MDFRIGPNEDRFDERFKDALKDVEVMPGRHTWANIQANLPQKKPQRALPVILSPFRRLGKVAIAAAIAISFITFGVLNRNVPGGGDAVQFNAAMLGSIDGFGQWQDQLLTSQRNYQLAQINAIGELENSVQNNDPIFIKEEPSNTPEDLFAANSTNVAEEASVYTLSIINPELESESKASLNTTILLDEEEKRIIDNNPDIAGMHIGVQTNATSNWIMTKPEEGIDHPEMYDRQIDPGFGIGLTAGYDFSSKFGIESGLIYQRVDYRYQPIGWDLPFNEEVHRLSYVKVPVLMKFKWSRAKLPSGLPKSINYIVGMEYAHLNSSLIFRDGHITGVANNYNNNELGVVMGLDYDVYMKNSMILTLGARAGLSGDAQHFPGILNPNSGSPANFSVGVNLGIKFLAKKNQ